jgi:hypothetical protein
MATEVTLRPARAGEAIFAEGYPHRSGLASVYNVYSWADAATPGTDDIVLVLRPAAGAVLADIADDAALRDRVGRHTGRPAQVVTAGLTHPDTAGSGPGVGFFGPDEIRAQAREWGWPDLERRFGAALDAFTRPARSWLHVVRHQGLGSAGELYQAVRADRASSPAEAHVVDVTGE